VKLLLEAVKPDEPLLSDNNNGKDGVGGGSGHAQKKGKKGNKGKKNKNKETSEEFDASAASSPGSATASQQPQHHHQELEVGGADGGLLGLRHLEVLTNLGECHFHGEGVRKDRPHAAKLYRQAAQLGYAPAQANLAEMFVKGEGVEKDDGAAFGWFAAAAAQGLAEGQHGLGACYESGDGVPVSSSGDGLPKADNALAAFWFEKAAVQGHQGAVEAAEQLEKALRR